MLEEQLTKLRKAIDGRLSSAFPLGRLPIIVLQHAAQSLLTPDRSSIPTVGLIRQDQPIAKTLVIALAMIMYNEFVNRFAQCAFTEENHALQAGAAGFVTRLESMYLTQSKADPLGPMYR